MSIEKKTTNADLANEVKELRKKLSELEGKKKEDTRPKRNVTTCIDGNVYDETVKIAETKGWSISKVVRNALEEYVGVGEDE